MNLPCFPVISDASSSNDYSAAQETDEAAVKRFMEYINEFRDETKTKTRCVIPTVM